MLKNFLISGKASFILGGQFGSCGKGAAAAWSAWQLGQQSPASQFDITTTNAGCQSGHTSIHMGVRNVAFHLPTVPLIAPGSVGYLNAGAVIDLDVLSRELEVHGHNFSEFYIHPNAAVITRECREAEGRADSAQTKIASTRKGVGEALSRKVLRSGISAAMAMPTGKPGGTVLGGAHLRALDLCRKMSRGKSVLVEVPQGIGLSLNGPFYPHCTSRDCTVMQAASDAQIHPSFVGPVMLVLRTFPIRVGNILETPVNNKGGVNVVSGNSGGCYPDQHETTWAALGVPPEITTVTKRVRRVFTWSHRQVVDAFISARPTHVFLSHVDYLHDGSSAKGGTFQERALETYILSLQTAAAEVGIPVPQIFYSTGPTTADVQEWVA